MAEESIMYNPETLAAIAGKFKEFNGEMETHTGDFATIKQNFANSWSGEEAAEAQEVLGRLQQSLDLINEGFNAQQQFVDNKAKDFERINLKF